MPSPDGREAGLAPLLDYPHISAYNVRMRRKPGALLPIEVSLLKAGVELAKGGSPEFHGYLIARQIRDREAAKRLTAHGTLYRALDRMEAAGLLVSSWEDPQLGEAEGRPRRRLYRVTAVGEQALARVLRERAVAVAAPGARGLAPS